MCEEFYDKVYNFGDQRDFNIGTKKKTIGIELLYKYNFKEDKWELERTKEGYFKVGKITNQYLKKYSKPGNIQYGDVILSINDIDLREAAKDTKVLEILTGGISDFFKIDEKISFKLKRDGKIIEITHYEIDKKKYDFFNEELTFDEPFIDFYVESINVDEKNGVFNATIETSISRILDKEYSLHRIVKETLVEDQKFDQNGNLESFYWYQCDFPQSRWNKLDTIDPNYGLKIYNLVALDQNQLKSNYNIKPIWYEQDNGSLVQDETELVYSSHGVYTIANQFNLKSFPFDNQVLKIFLYNDKFNSDEFRADQSSYSMTRAQLFQEKDNIQGWRIENIIVKPQLYEKPNSNALHDGVVIEIEIERKYWFYIFKIILPIILILTICWSSIWIDPREIESRLTITIVCLLSLIAYNFVISEDVPKLDYLTVMDSIILISYLYAAIPNFLSVLSHHMVKTKNRDILEYEEFQKRFGLPSYLLIISVIISFNLIRN